MSNPDFRAQLALFKSKALAGINRAVKAQRLHNWLMLESLDRWLEKCPSDQRQQPSKSFRSA